jgi:hypothetical protein
MRRIMYVENKSEGLDGDGRIGWVELSGGIDEDFRCDAAE